MKLRTPKFIRIAQESGRELDIPGTLLRLNSDLADGYTHGVVVEISEDGKLVILPGNSRSEVLNAEGERVGLYIEPGQLEQIGAVYDGRIGQMPRVVSKDAQSQPPKKLPYDPEQPGHYLYVERPISEAPPGAMPVDERSIPTVLYERTLPQGGPEVNELRQDLTNAQNMSRALAVHIADVEDMRKVNADFATLVNAGQDVMRRSEQRSRQEYRDPAGKLLQQPDKRSKDMYVALSMMDKVRSGLETSGLFLVQYRNVLYQLKLHSDIIQRFTVNKQGDQMMKFRDWMMTYNEFANAWSREAIARNKVFTDARGALRKAWDRYRAKHSIFLRRELTRYGQLEGRPNWKVGDPVWTATAGDRGIIRRIEYISRDGQSLPSKYFVTFGDSDQELDFYHVELVGYAPKFSMHESVVVDLPEIATKGEKGNGKIQKVYYSKGNIKTWVYDVVLFADDSDVPLGARGAVPEEWIEPNITFDDLDSDDEVVMARKAQLTDEIKVGDTVWYWYDGKPGKVHEISDSNYRPFKVHSEDGEIYPAYDHQITKIAPKYSEGDQATARFQAGDEIPATITGRKFSPEFKVWLYTMTLEGEIENYSRTQELPETMLREFDPFGAIDSDDEIIMARKAQVRGVSLGDYVKYEGTSDSRFPDSPRHKKGRIDTIEIFGNGYVKLDIHEWIEDYDEFGDYDDRTIGEVQVYKPSQFGPTSKPMHESLDKVIITDGPYKGSTGVVDYMFNQITDEGEITGWRVVCDWDREHFEDSGPGQPIPSSAIPEELLTRYDFTQHDDALRDVDEGGDEIIMARKAQVDDHMVDENTPVGTDVWYMNTGQHFKIISVGSTHTEVEADDGTREYRSAEHYRTLQPKFNIGATVSFNNKHKYSYADDRTLVGTITAIAYDRVGRHWMYLVNHAHHDPDTQPTSGRTSQDESDLTLVNDPSAFDSGEEIVMARKASILDEPRATLNPSIFDLSGDAQAPKMLPEVRAAIFDQLGKLNLPESAIKSILFFGSAAAYQYEETSDLDVTVVVDEEQTDLNGLMKEISDELYIAEHPVTYFLRTNEYPIDGSDAIYDMINDIWIRVPEASEGAIHKEEYQDTVEDAVEWAKKLDLMLGETRRDYIDFEKLELAYQHVGEDKKAEVLKRIEQKLSEISEDVAAFALEKDKLHQTRAVAFAEELEKHGENTIHKYLSRNWLPENILYKILERYQYTKLLKHFKQINDKRLDNDKNWVKELKHGQYFLEEGEPLWRKGDDVYLAVEYGGPIGSHAVVLDGAVSEIASGIYEVLIKTDTGEEYGINENSLVSQAPKYHVGQEVVYQRIKSEPFAGVIDAIQLDSTWEYGITREDGKRQMVPERWIKPKQSHESIDEGEEVVIAQASTIDYIEKHQPGDVVFTLASDNRAADFFGGDMFTIISVEHQRQGLPIVNVLDDKTGSETTVRPSVMVTKLQPQFRVGEVVVVKPECEGEGIEYVINAMKFLQAGNFERMTSKGWNYWLAEKDDSRQYEGSIPEECLASVTDIYNAPEEIVMARKVEAAEQDAVVVVTDHPCKSLIRTIGTCKGERDGLIRVAAQGPMPFLLLRKDQCMYVSAKLVTPDDLDPGTVVYMPHSLNKNTVPVGTRGKIVDTEHGNRVIFESGDDKWLMMHVAIDAPRFKTGDTVVYADKHTDEKVYTVGDFEQHYKIGHWSYDLYDELGDYLLAHDYQDGTQTFEITDRRAFDPESEDDIVIAQKQTQEFNVVDWITETKEAVDDYTQNVEELKTMYSKDLIYLEKLEDHQAIAESQGEGLQSDPAVVQTVAASLKTGQEMYHLDSYTPEGNIKDAEPLIVKASMLISHDENEITVVGESGQLQKISRGRLITAQSEIRPRRRKKQLTVEDPGETDLEDILGKPTTPKLKPAVPKKKPKLQPSRPDVPPGMLPVDAEPETVGAEPVQQTSYDVGGEQVPVVEPTKLIQAPPPPKPSAPVPSVPSPDELEEVRFDDIPEEEWKKMSLSERIRLGAVYNQIIAMEYEKITPPETGVQKTYIIEPYSYRVKRPQRTNGAAVWYLFAFDTQDNHIKAFIVRNIRGIEILDETFSPRWDVEFFPSQTWEKYRQNRRPQQPAPEDKVTFVTTPFEA
jgi:predicted nucleotidyltransferase